MEIDLAPAYEEAIRKILKKHIPDAAVWAFGSRAKWTAKDTSDLDLVIISDKKTSSKVMTLLKLDFEDSELPFKVDILDWQSISEEFQGVIKKEYVVFQDRKLDPSLRKKIGHFLYLLDEKIISNKKRNKILQSIAQTIFKSWFVDFDPVHAKKKALEKGLSKDQAERAAMAIISGICSPSDFAENFKEMDLRLTQKPSKMSKKDQKELAHTASLFPSEFEDSKLGEIPSGWRLGELKDEIEFNPKLSLKKSSIAKYVDMKSLPTSGHRIACVFEREFNSGSKFQNGDVLMARITPCLENGKTAYVDCLVGSEVAWGSTEFIVMRSRGNLPDYWVYLLSRNNSFVEFAISNMSSTSGRQRVPSSVLEGYKFVFSDNNLLSKFGHIIHSFAEEIKLNSEENQILENLRDTLLPKLLAGEIDLSNIKLDKELSLA